MVEAKITYNYIVKELDDIKQIYEVEAILNKALEATINRLVEDQIKESEGLKSNLKKIKHMHNVKNHHLRKNLKLAKVGLKWEEDRNKRLHKEIESKKKENVELHEKYRKYKRLHNEALY